MASIYIQKVRGYEKDEIAKNLRSDMGSENTEAPEYQVGGGCLVDQLDWPIPGRDRRHGPPGVAGKYSHARCVPFTSTTTSQLSSITNNVERTYALNDEAAVVVCDYGKAERPHIPFPYYAEAWTGQEYSSPV